MLIETNNYEIFKAKRDNRKISQKHVNDLIESIQKENLLYLRPILVNEQMEIIDGQHRLEAARSMGVPVYYEIINDFHPNSLLYLNTVKQWSTNDYLNFYVNHGYEEYIKFDKYIKEKEINISLALESIGQKSAGDYKKFRQGFYQHEITEYADVCIDICKSTVDVLKKTGLPPTFIHSNRFWRALSALARNPLFLRDKWFYNLQRVGDKIGPRSTYKQCTRDVHNVYNWKNQSPINFHE